MLYGIYHSTFHPGHRSRLPLGYALLPLRGVPLNAPHRKADTSALLTSTHTTFRMRKNLCHLPRQRRDLWKPITPNGICAHPCDLWENNHPACSGAAKANPWRAERPMVAYSPVNPRRAESPMASSAQGKRSDTLGKPPHPIMPRPARAKVNITRSVSALLPLQGASRTATLYPGRRSRLPLGYALLPLRGVL